MIEHLWRWLFGKVEYHILIRGLGSAGRTAILYKLKLGKTIETIPTIGINVETMEWKGCDLNILDIGGGDNIRTLYRHFIQNTAAIIYVVDATDSFSLLSKETEEDRFDKDMRSSEGLLFNTLREDELRDCIVLIYLNKQDLPNAISVETFKQQMKLSERISHRGYSSLQNRLYHIQPCSIITGEGLEDGLDWLITSLENRRQKIAPPVPPPPPTKPTILAS